MMMKRLAAAAAVVTLAPLTLAACGDDSSPSAESVDSLTVLDYYTDEPTTSQVRALLEKCGASIGAKIDRTAVPGPQLIQKVLQQASSKTLPDVLMLDNPDIQQIAATGALAPLDDFGIKADGYATGPVSAATHNGKLYGLWPRLA
jgi:multiple sugar transport system substrate-binding protein